MGEVLNETDLRDKSSSDGNSLGLLPKGTIVLIKSKSNDYFQVEVELEDGSIEGWVLASEVNRSGDPKVKESSSSSQVEESRPGRGRFRSRPRIRLPKDEGLLLRREKTFFYGVHTRANFNIIETDIDTFFYLGLGFTAGGHIGFYIVDRLPLRFSAAYTLVSGTAADNGVNLTFGFFDLAGELLYPITDRFEIFGGGQYSAGLSFNDIDPAINLATPADASSLYVFGGIGYRIPSGEYLEVVIRLRYSFSFLRAPIGIQIFGVGVSLEFGG